MRYKPLLVLCIALLMIPIASAMDWDNVKSYEAVDGTYGKITIDNAFGLGDILAEYTLLENTDECLTNCYANGVVTLYQPDSLFDDITLYNNGRDEIAYESKIYFEKTEQVDVNVTDYQEQCEASEDAGNGTETEECTRTPIGTHIYSYNNTYWYEYNPAVDEVLPAGTYKWKIEGTKQPYESIDWVMTTMGVELDDWAWWSGYWLYKRNLNLTANRLIGSNSTVNFTLDTATLITAGKMQNDCGDLRMTYNNAEIDLRVTGCNSTTSKLEFAPKADLIGNASSYLYDLYYGNPSASNPSVNYSNIYYRAYTGESYSNGTLLNNTGYVFQAGDPTKVYYSSMYAYEGTMGIYFQSEDGTNNYGSWDLNVQSADGNFLYGNFYDNGSLASGDNALIDGGNNAGVPVVGIHPDGDETTYYQTKDVTVLDTSISRSAGWHYVEMYGNLTGTFLRLDNTTVRSVNSDLAEPGAEADNCDWWFDNIIYGINALNTVALGAETNLIPTHTTPIINTTLGLNFPFENITVYNQSTTDVSGYGVKNIYTWYKNGNPWMVLNMPFDINGSVGNTTNVKDYSGYGNNGSISGSSMPRWNSTGGRDGFGAYTFDGTNDKITIKDNDLLSFVSSNTSDLSFSINFLLNLDYNKSVGIFRKQNEYTFYVSPSANLVWALYSNNSASNYLAIMASSSLTELCNTKICDITLVYSGNKSISGMYIYINGVRRTVTNQSIGYYYGMDNTNNDLAIGYTSIYLNGTIDEFMMWNYSLSDEQIKALYGNQTNRIVQQDVSSNDNWTVYVTPINAYSEGTTLSASINILNDSPPTHANPILNSTLGTNKTIENITAYNQSTVDVSGYGVKNIYTWYKNTKPHALLYMPFDMNGSMWNTTSVTDYSGYGNNGSISGGNRPRWNRTGDYIGFGAYEFDGTDDNIKLSDATKVNITTEDFTISVRFRRAGSGSGAIENLAGKRNSATATNPGYQLYTGGGKLNGIVCDGSASRILSTGTTIITNDTWHHAAMTVDREGNMKIYLDGVLEDTDSVTAQPGSISNSNIFSIGSAAGGSANYFNGTIDDVRVWNISLSAEQIKAIYGNESNRIVKQELTINDNWTVYVTPINYAVEGVSKSASITILSNNAPRIDRYAQDPTDLTSTNIFAKYLNITYNITDDMNYVANTTFYWNVNTSTSDVFKYINGTAYSGINSNPEKIVNETAALWQYKLCDNQVYPATYNINSTLMENTTHEPFNLTGINHYAKVRLYNVSNQKRYSMFEVYAKNMTSTSQPLRIYYCNSSYTTGSLTGSSNCYNFNSIAATDIYNHTHSEHSMHYVAPFAINTDTGMIGTVYVTETSYFALRGTNEGWSIYYIGNLTSADAMRTSTTAGGTWSNFAGTFDAHLHQYNGTEQLWYYACATGITNLKNCSAMSYDLINLTGLPPTDPSVYLPASGNYTSNISIAYTAAVSPNSYTIDHYNITLVNMSYIYNYPIKSSLTGLTYSYNTTQAADGEYMVRVEACDIYNQCSYGYSDNFTINNNLVIATNASVISSSSYNYTNGNLIGSWGIWSRNGSNPVVNETRWWKNGVLNTTFANLSVIHGKDGVGNFTPLDVWNFSVRFYDGEEWTPWTNNASITIVNDIPQPLEVNVSIGSLGSLSKNYRNETMNVNWSFTDIYNLSISMSEIRWWRNGIINTTFANISYILPPNNLTAGDVWNVSVRVYDGYDWSAWSDNETITVKNAPPYLIDLNIFTISKLNMSNESIYINVTYADLDGNNTILYNETKWYKNDVENTSMKNQTIFTPSYVKTDEMNLSLRLFDGTNFSDWRSVWMTMTNTPPYLPTTRDPNTSITSYAYNMAFNCSGATDTDGDAINYEFWVGNSTNYTMQQNSTATTFLFTYPSENNTFYFNCRANDGGSRNGWMGSNITIYWNNTEIQEVQDFHNPTADTTSNQSFRFNVSYYDQVISDVNAVIYYNGTAHTATEVNGSNKTQFVSNFAVPLTLTDKIYNFTWNITRVLSNGTIKTSGYNYTQTVETVDFFMTGCDTSNTTHWRVLNISIKDEVNDSVLNADLEITWVVWMNLSGATTNFTFNTDFTSTNNTLICLNALNTTGDVYITNAQIQYQSTGYASRDYFLYHFALDNLTDDIILYQRMDSEVSDIIFHVNDEASNPLIGYYIQAQAYDVGSNAYKLVAMGKTNDDGEDLISLRRDDTWFRFIIKDNEGDVVFTSQKQKILSNDLYFVISETTFSSVWNKLEGIDYSLSFTNSTRTFALTYSTSSGTITEGCLQVYSLSGTGRTQYCDTCVSSASSTISCKVPDTAGNYFGEFYIKRSDIQKVIDNLEYTELVGNAFNQKLGQSGLLMTLVVVATMTMAGIFSPIAAVVLGIGAFIFMAIIGILKISYVAMLGITLVAVIIISRLRD